MQILSQLENTFARDPKDCLRLKNLDRCLERSSDAVENDYCFLTVRFRQRLQHPSQTISEAITTKTSSLLKVLCCSSYLRGRLCVHETIRLYHRCHQKLQH